MAFNKVKGSMTKGVLKENHLIFAKSSVSNRSLPCLIRVIVVTSYYTAVLGNAVAEVGGLLYYELPRY